MPMSNLNLGVEVGLLLLRLRQRQRRRRRRHSLVRVRLFSLRRYAESSLAGCGRMRVERVGWMRVLRGVSAACSAH